MVSMGKNHVPLYIKITAYIEQNQIFIVKSYVHDHAVSMYTAWITMRARYSYTPSKQNVDRQDG